jgi:hypothetical protein
MNACTKREGRRDHHSQAASISDNDNGAVNLNRIARNFKPAAVNTNTNNRGDHASSINLICI